MLRLTLKLKTLTVSLLPQLASSYVVLLTAISSDTEGTWVLTGSVRSVMNIIIIIIVC